MLFIRTSFKFRWDDAGRDRGGPRCNSYEGQIRTEQIGLKSEATTVKMAA